MRACVRACVRAYVRACVRECVRRLYIYGREVLYIFAILKVSRLAECVCEREREIEKDLIPGHLLTFSASLSDDIWKNEIRKEYANSLCLPNTVLSPFLWVFLTYRN